MSPEYLNELADLADPDSLWRLSGIDQRQLPVDKKRQLDMGVALRRHAEDMRRVREAAKQDKGMLLTQLGPSVYDMRYVDPPAQVRRRMADMRARGLAGGGEHG